ncbi:MAG: hypothetical protein EAZ57_08940 [Cytophagales bacterium]|nr:MAG: hypothetical protein EAZ67_09750 [Cytophagales bacterium]TAF60025.1 MAG: hypothetical protein EAZ57_08940 [Cytophagales bacterium]
MALVKKRQKKFTRFCFLMLYKTKFFCSLGLILGLWINSGGLVAQEFPMHEIRFGKNRLQHKDFEWKSQTTDNFEFYYSPENASLLEQAQEWSEKELKRISSLLGYAPYSRIQVFLYNSPQDLLQSNIGINTQSFKQSGRSNYNESLVEIAFQGSFEAFKRELSNEIAHVVLLEMMYGRNIKDILRSGYLLNLPDWFIAGAAAYIADGWTLETDNFARANCSNKSFLKPDGYKANNAKLIGQAIWNFVIQRYGIDNFSNILNLTRMVRNERSAFQGTLRMGFGQIMSDCRDFYAQQLQDVQKGMLIPNGIPVVGAIKADERVSQIALSPNGENMAFVKNKNGISEIFVKKMPNGKVKKVYQGGYVIFNQKSIPNQTLFSWLSDQELLVLGLEKGVYQIQKVVLGVKKQEKPTSFNFFEVVNQMNISADKQTLVLSASKKNQTDIYSYNLKSKQLKQHTDDGYDEFSPCFDGNDIIFSSNKPAEALSNLGQISKLNNYVFPYQNIYRLKGNDLKSITNDLAQNDKPLCYKKDLLFVGSPRGIKQIYRAVGDNQLIEPLTNFITDVEAFDYQNGHLLIMTANQADKTIFYFKNYTFSATNMSNKTARQVIIDQYNVQIVKFLQEEASKSGEKKSSKDSLKTDSNSDEIYQFDTFDSRNKKRKNGQSESGYESLFFVDQTTFSFAYDPLRKFGFFIETGLTDALEHHKLDAGAFNLGLNTFRDGVIYVQYQYLKKRTDFKLRLDRQALVKEALLFEQRYSLNKLTATASYPFSTSSRISASVFGAQTRFVPTSNLTQFIQSFRSAHVSYAGFSTEFVLDNARETGPNMRSGTQVKMSWDNFFALDAKKKSFGNINLDARQYVQITPNLMWVGRLSLGKFFGAGSSSKSYRIGGLNNWLFGGDDSENKNAETDPLYLDVEDPEAYKVDLSDLLFVRYPMPLRGFNWNKLNGNSFVQFNTELRMTVLPEFYRRTVKSKFAKNLQVAAFVDAGSAWTGVSPFNRANALNTVEIGGQRGNPFFAKVSNFKDPFLVGYGLGLRSRILNYFTKFDIAWGLEDDVIMRERYHLSIGYDF